MNRIDVPTLLTIIYVLVDDWYQEQGYRLTPMLPGPEPSFSDSEMWEHLTYAMSNYT
ncbi:hypothetical protein PN502_17590 [Microcystis aeruginosa CS-338/01]|uniref:hypothetical protein n=1 Tax=Microcystis aeruginosa TaxID=1126 RepID=UPI00232CC847|nr:hypothetical protein [Microcystis aeruginosa]MDB9508837.1 hypothetical protein [Microcystis aeruginosa CS-338/01]